jgi:hypothetical protein
MRPLVDSMVHKDPSKRPDINSVVTQFETIRHTLSNVKLRSRAADRNEFTLTWLVREFIHWVQQLQDIVLAVPPLGL